MRISSNYFTTNFLNEVNSLQQQQNTLQQESSSGLKVTLPEDDPSAMTSVLNLQSEQNENTQYQNNVTTLQNSATTAYTAMNSLKTISDRIDEIATDASNGTTSSTQLAAYSSEVGNLIQEAVQLGNTQDANGNYIFGGTATNQPPFVATTDASGNVTSVAYQGNTSVAKSEIAPNVTVTAQVPGANTTGTGPAGLFTNSSTGADLFNHMIALQQDLNSGNTSAISSTDAPALQNDESNIVSQISANSVLQSTLTNAASIQTSQSTNMTTQISNDSSADLATTLTELSQTQNAYQAALESGTMVFSFSLVNYLQ